MQGDPAHARLMPRMGRVPPPRQLPTVHPSMQRFQLGSTAPLPNGTSLEQLGHAATADALPYESQPSYGNTVRGHLTRHLAAAATAHMTEAVQTRDMEFLRTAVFSDGTPALAGAPQRLSDSKYDAAHDQQLHSLLTRYGMAAPLPDRPAAAAVPLTEPSFEPLEGSRPEPVSAPAPSTTAPARAAGVLPSLRTPVTHIGVPPPAPAVTPFDEAGRRMPASSDEGAARLLPDYSQPRWGGRGDSMTAPAARREERGYELMAYRESFAELAQDATRMVAPRDYLGPTRPTDALLRSMGMRYEGYADQPQRVSR